jgi:hypothetical protein
MRIKCENLSNHNKESLRLMYNINNLITLCADECHWMAHNNSGYHINISIQKELQIITNNRIIPQDLLDEYNEIVKTKIEPWLDKLSC